VHPITQVVSLIHPLGPDAVDALEGIIEERPVRKNTVIVRIGRRCEHMHFVVRGLARVYYMRDGEDVTDYFATEHSFVGAIPSLFNGQPSTKGVDVLEDSIIARFRYADMERLCDDHPDLERLMKKLAIIGFLEVQERLEKLRFQSVKERYDELERLHPGITNRLPLRHVASFLGTTPVSISRIRAGKQ
jgi:CRP-like cAMP-binding protein